MKLRCRLFDHDWFPDAEAREFLPVEVRCLRCGAEEVRMPYGQCLGGHPIAEHYIFDSATPNPARECAGPR